MNKDIADFPKKIAVCAFAEAADHVGDLQRRKIQAIVFELTKKQKIVFREGAGALQEITAGNDTTIYAERARTGAPILCNRWEGAQKRIIDVSPPPQLITAFALMGSFADMGQLSAHHHFAIHTPPHNKRHVNETGFHRDQIVGTPHKQNEIHVHVTVDADGLLFKEHPNWSTWFSKKHQVPEGFGVLFNGTWLHAVEKDAKKTGRTAFGAHIGTGHTYDPMPLVGLQRD